MGEVGIEPTLVGLQSSVQPLHHSPLSVVTVVATIGVARYTPTFTERVFLLSANDTRVPLLWIIPDYPTIDNHVTVATQDFNIRWIVVEWITVLVVSFKPDVVVLLTLDTTSSTCGQERNISFRSCPPCRWFNIGLVLATPRHTC